MVLRTRSRTPCTASGCEAMYSSTDLKSVLAIVVPVSRDHSATLRRRSALAITDTELKVIAALAIIGLSSRPKNG